MYLPPDSNTKHTASGVKVPRWRKRKQQFVDPHKDTGRPSQAVAQDWASSQGVLGYYNYNNVRDYLQPDIRNYIFPSGVGRSWAGRQQLNGVSQLSSALMVPQRAVYRDRNGRPIRGRAPLPYWQASQPSVNQQQINRFGGQAGEVAGPITTNQWKDLTYAGIPDNGGPTGGPGTVSVVASLRARFGF